MSYLDKNGNYYEGDKQYGDTDVPKRPSSEHQYVNGEWVLPAPTLDRLKQIQIDLAEQAYQTANTAPIDYMLTQFQADSASQQLIAAVLTACGGTLPVGFVWFDINNTPVPMTFAELQGLAGSILMRGQPLFITKQIKKAAVRACLTVAELDLYLNPPPPEPLP